MPLVEVENRKYQGEILEIEFSEISESLIITPNHSVARVLPDLPKRSVQRSTVQYLRQSLTESEEKMWNLLRRKGTGVRFRRQHPLATFILDFYSPQIRLAIEIDGGIHENWAQKEYDRFRQELIEIHGIEVLRLKNENIRNLDQLPEMLTKTIAERIQSHWYNLIWTPAGQIQIKDMVYASGRKEKHTIQSIRRFKTNEKIYDLQVAEDHSFVTSSCTLAASSTHRSKENQNDI